jgi:glucan-binding YG repeat protein
MAVGLVTLSDGVYLFDANGNMQTGIVDIGGLPFLFGDDGKLVIAQ